ncbi:hypothetical protein [Streptomyces acidiscabies]|uniref:hypothetical protein n=1 Tax=Streptomyces acidiscabies TaxID=42234 RepID=UPI0038F7E4FB
MARTYGSRDAREREYRTPAPAKANRGADLVRLSPLVAPEIHATAFQNAKAMGVSMSMYIAELIRQDQVDENGIPLWWKARMESGKGTEQAPLPLTES